MGTAMLCGRKKKYSVGVSTNLKLTGKMNRRLCVNESLAIGLMVVALHALCLFLYCDVSSNHRT